MEKKIEGISDVVLFVLVTIPLFIALITTPFCNGWNEGSMAGTCTIPALEGIYNVFNGIMLSVAFGGFLIILPLILIALVISIRAKTQALSRDEQWNTLPKIAQLVPIASAL